MWYSRSCATTYFRVELTEQRQQISTNFNNRIGIEVYQVIRRKGRSAPLHGGEGQRGNQRQRS